MSRLNVYTPFKRETDVTTLKAGDQALVSGTIYTARDAAHKRLVQQIRRDEKLPVALHNQVIYYVGPTPAKPDEVIGSAGPTTSSRMDRYTPDLLELGLKGMIGKGYRSQEVIDAIAEHNAVYLAAIGGTGALLSRTIQSVEMAAYEDLGTEAIRKIIVKDFPCIVINDSEGRDWYKESQKQFKV